MQNQLPKIEPLPGSLHLQRVKCGKPNCRCAGGEGHAAFYRFWRERGKLRKVYVRRSDVETVRAGLARWREGRQLTRALLSGRDAAEALRQQRETLRAAGLEPSRRFYPAKAVRDEGPRVEELAAAFVSFTLPNFRFS